MSKTRRLVLGILILLIVDILWVGSSELTEFIFHEEKYNKPFFSTYLKTSLFTTFLLGFCIIPSWRQHCKRRATYGLVETTSVVESDPALSPGEDTATLSTPMYVPLKSHHDGGDKSSGTESDDSSLRSVRFSKITEVRHMSTTDATDALLARLSYEASVNAEETVRRLAKKLPVIDVIKLALTFCILWFLGNCTYQMALAETQAAVVNVLSSSSSLFTLVLAAVFPSTPNDRFTLSKFVAVLMSMCGVVLVSMSDLKLESPIPTGAIFALVSAVFYACYLVFLRRKVDHEDKIDIPMFFAFVGLFNLLLLWPLFFLFNYTREEVFEWPNKEQLIFLFINGFLGTVLSEVLWLWACFLTSSLIATLSLSLTIPMSMFADVMFKDIKYSAIFYVGSTPMFVAFFAVTLLAHYENWDPIFELLRRICYLSCRKRSPVRIRDGDCEQRESLIGVEGDHEA